MGFVKSSIAMIGYRHRSRIGRLSARGIRKVPWESRDPEPTSDSEQLSSDTICKSGMKSYYDAVTVRSQGTYSSSCASDKWRCLLQRGDDSTEDRGMVG